MGGIMAAGMYNIVIQIDGSLMYADFLHVCCVLLRACSLSEWRCGGIAPYSYSNDLDQWPRDKSGHVLECMYLQDLSNVTFTSSGVGLVDGQGERWWGVPGVGYLVRGEDRPRLLNIANSKNLLVEKLYLKNSPYWTFWVRISELRLLRLISARLARRTVLSVSV
jgi:hypothetical protein